MLYISQNGGSWFGLDGNGQEAFETDENMGGAVQRSVAQMLDW